MQSFDKSQKPTQQKFCNCRNSKCMKLYCECFAANQQCNKLCRCTNCHNHKDSEYPKLYRAAVSGTASKAKQNLLKQGKGCSCRKSFCIKKYCECFQEGVLCGQFCKCIECQNNQSMTNRNVLINLKKTTSNTSNRYCSLYPIILSQSNEHLNHLIDEENSLNFQNGEVEEGVRELFAASERGGLLPIVQKFINILKKIDEKLNRSDLAAEQLMKDQEDFLE